METNSENQTINNSLKNNTFSGRNIIINNDINANLKELSRTEMICSNCFFNCVCIIIIIFLFIYYFKIIIPQNKTILLQNENLRLKNQLLEIEIEHKLKLMRNITDN